MVGIIMIVLNVLYVCRVSVFLEPSEECVRYSRNTSTPDVPTHTYTKYIACQGVGHVTIWFSASCWSFPYIQERKVVLLAQNSWPHDTSWHRLVVWFPISRWVSTIYCENINSKNVIPVFISHGCGAEIFCTEKPKRCSLSALFEHCLRLRFEISYKRKQIRVK